MLYIAVITILVSVIRPIIKKKKGNRVLPLRYAQSFKNGKLRERDNTCLGFDFCTLVV